jgi:hypothetical protein
MDEAADDAAWPLEGEKDDIINIVIADLEFEDFSSTQKYFYL